MRYNAGGCGTKRYDNKEMAQSPNIQSSRQMCGFWVDGISDDPYSSSFDWSKDPNQIQMVQFAKERGVNLIELFSNSPMLNFFFFFFFFLFCIKIKID